MVGALAEKRVMPLRARRDEDKEARRRELLDAARALFEATSFAEVKMADVAARTGLAKGTVFLYFPTKEALFLALLDDLLTAWFAKLNGLLAEGGTWTGHQLARTVAGSLEGEETFTRLLALAQTVLEQNVTVAQAQAFKERVLVSMGTTAALLQARLSFLTPESAVQLIRHVHALMTGLRQMADIAPVAREVLTLPHMAPLRVDFSAELTAAITTLLRGLEAR
ncbi:MULTISPECIES: TetR/AcrR family transcriptional regulator [unclassified Corallococcus]|uniref:TetR/AcrR family transcriptional regulator n=1 Tax=unclassified Corallococcus TaxID=2685029 RepID=UPI001A90963F|nr:MULTISPECIES: TetR family transcriptional regulator [unclassified Corallococcus]MBN9680861.1 TetR family transcriptional regulator [Corallococcus sp. NCSPR001]WAS87535.1 TetR family transcriptional regulator [Corallococcus sp. NCRR]